MPQQLQMIWSTAEKSIPAPTGPAGYTVRPFQDGDESGHISVMHAAGFTTWDKTQLLDWIRKIALPNGVFVAVHQQSLQVVATALASHRPTDLHPAGGELGWVAASPQHAGQGLGRAVSVAALRRLRDAGYERIYLLTDDHRLAAIKTYLQLGFRPFLFAPDMAPRWQAVCVKLDFSIEPGVWPRAPHEMWLAEPADKRPDSDQVERYADGIRN